MSFEVPQNLEAWVPFIIPAFTMLVGLIYFLFPRSALAFVGLEGTERHPEGFGDGRSTFASFAIAVSLMCILFQQPILFQMLGLSWLLIAVGRVLHFVLDGGFREKLFFNLFRIVVSVGIAVRLYLENGLPEMVLSPQVSMPVGLAQQLPFVAAVITFIFGLISLFTPRWALKIVRMQAKPEVQSGWGEPRGLLAGFYLAVGGLGLLYPDVTGVPGLFIGMTIGVCWILAGFGRMIAILSDGCNNLFNWISLIMELALALLPLVVIFNLLPN